MTRLIFQVSANENYDGLPYGVLEVNKELIKQAAERLSRFNRLFKKDADSLETRYWDYRFQYTGPAPDATGVEVDIEELYGEDYAAQLDNIGYFVEPVSFGPVHFEDIRVETCVMVISQSSVWWEAREKHTYIELVSATIKLSALKEILNAHSVPPSRNRKRNDRVR